MTVIDKDIRNDADTRIFGEWVARDSRVLDLGCGRGALLAHLARERVVFGVGVDNDHEKISACLERGVNGVQGDLLTVLRSLPDASFDWVVCSRVLQELNDPAEVVLQAMRVGRRVAVAFVNNGHWRNRLAMLRYGHRSRSLNASGAWYRSEPTNPLSITDFEEFCAHYGIAVARRVYLAADWKTPCTILPKLTAGYGVYELVWAEK